MQTFKRYSKTTQMNEALQKKKNSYKRILNYKKNGLNLILCVISKVPLSITIINSQFIKAVRRYLKEHQKANSLYIKKR